MSNEIPHKWQRVVMRLLDGPLHRFEAERGPVFDHCLPSTISELRSRYGLQISAKTIRLPGYAGLGAYVAEYSLEPGSADRARTLVGAISQDAQGAT